MKTQHARAAGTSGYVNLRGVLGLGLACLGAFGVSGQLVESNRLPVESWTARYMDHVRPAVPVRLALDPTGGIVVSGLADGAGTGPDWLTVKYNPAGIQQWTTRFDSYGPDTIDWSSDVVSDMAVDAQGCVYVTGYGRSESDFATVKYDAAGNPLWVARYFGTGIDPANSGATALALGPGGTVVAAGFSQGAGTGRDMATVAYDSAGRQLWAARYTSPGVQFDTPARVVCDAGGGVVVAGESYVDNDHSEYVVLRYDAAGQLLWTARHAFPGSEHNLPSGLAMDGAGNIYVLGTTSFQRGMNPDYGLVKFSGAGALLWAVRYDGPVGSYDHGSMLVLDSAGWPVVTGTSCGYKNPDTSVDPVSDFLTIKYDPAGAVVWRARQPARGGDGGVCMALDAQDNVLVTGGARPDGSNWVWLTLKYDSSGNRLWKTEFVSFVANSGAVSRGVVAAPDGSVYVTGAAGGDYCTVKYTQAPVPGAPTITERPMDQTVMAGDMVSVWAMADSYGLLSYQWMFNGRPIPGATDWEYVIPCFLPEHEGEYSLEAASPEGNTASPAARVTIAGGGYPARNLQARPAVAADGTNFLAVWMDGRNRQWTSSDLDIYGARVTPQGEVLDIDGIEVCALPGIQRNPAVGFDGANYLVVWDETDDDGVSRIKGARVAPSGAVLDGGCGFVISEGTGPRERPVLAFNGGVWLVVWNDWRIWAAGGADTYDSDIFGARVSPAGAVLDPAGFPVKTGSADQTLAGLEPAADTFLMAWVEDGQVLAQRIGASGESTGTAHAVIVPPRVAVSPVLAARGTNIAMAWNEVDPGPVSRHYATRLSPEGMPLDGGGILLGTGSGASRAVSAAAGADRFWIAWETDSGNAGSDVQGRSLGYAGLQVEYMAGCGVAGLQNQPALASMGPGCLLAWMDGRRDPTVTNYASSRFDIYGMVLSSVGVTWRPDGGLISMESRLAPAIVWSIEYPMYYGDLLGEGQLDATADVPGVFVYQSPAGTLLNAGLDQVLRVTFIPSDTNRFQTVTAAATVNVLPRYLTLRADDRVCYQGQPWGPLTLTSYGLLPGQSLDELEAPPVLSTTATVGSPPGTYPIAIAGGVDRNYSVNAQPGVLTVLPPPGPPGVLDTVFDTTDKGANAGFGTGEIAALLPMPDGKVVVAGSFQHFNGIACPGLVRLNPDGSLDTVGELGILSSLMSLSALAPAAGGKILIGFNGCVETFGRERRFCRVARLNSDLTLDPTFVSAHQEEWGFVASLAVDPSGRILVGGVFWDWGGHPIRCVARLQPNGELDSEFEPEPLETDGEPGAGVNNIAVQPDGRIVLLGGFSAGSEEEGTRFGGLIRLENDGRRDRSFAPRIWVYTTSTDALVVQPDGRIVLAGHAYSYDGSMRTLVRLRPDGSTDTSFALPDGFKTWVSALGLLPDGGLLAGTSVYSEGGLARLLPSGELDPCYQAGLGPVDNAWVRTIAVASGGQAYAGGRFGIANGRPMSCVVRLDTGLQCAAPSIIAQPAGAAVRAGSNVCLRVEALGTAPLAYQWMLDGAPVLGATGPVLCLTNLQAAQSGWYRVGISNPIGTVTSLWARVTAHPALTNAGQVDSLFPGARGGLAALARQPDGRVLCAGDFSRLFRLLPDGSDDPSFSPRGFWSSYSTVPAVVVQPDGRILASVSDYTVADEVCHGVVRLLSDGQLDTSFRSALSANFYPAQMGLLSDGRVMVAGEENHGSYDLFRLVCLYPFGGLNPGINVLANSLIRMVTVLPDDRVLIGGRFTAVNGLVRSGLALVKLDGSVDTGFDAVIEFGGEVNCAAVQPDGRILVAGSFNQVRGTARPSIARLFPDGGLDSSFDPGDGIGAGEILALAVEPSGRILIGGTFDQVAGVPRGGMARLNADGSLDASFADPMLSSDPDDPVAALLIQGDGSAWAAGLFPDGLARVWLGGELPPAVPGLFLSGYGPASVEVLRAVGTPGRALAVQGSTTWTNWTTVGTVSLDATGQCLFTNNWSAIQRLRCYRLWDSEAGFYSSNAVGVLRRTLPPGISLLACPFQTENPAIGTLWTGASNGIAAFKPGIDGFEANSYLHGWFNPGMQLRPGEACVVTNPLASGAAVVVGGALEAWTTILRLSPGLSLVSLPSPVAGRLEADLGFPARDGDAVVRAQNGEYVVYSCIEPGMWDPSEPVLEAGEPFWLFNPSGPRQWYRGLPSSTGFNVPVLGGAGFQVNGFTWQPNPAFGRVWENAATPASGPDEGRWYLAQLYYGSIAVETGLVKTGLPVPFLSRADAGYLNAGLISIDTVQPSGLCYLQWRVWEAHSGYTYEQARASGGRTGRSDVFAALPWQPGSILPPAGTGGFRSFSLADAPGSDLCQGARLRLGAPPAAGQVNLVLSGRVGAVFQVQWSADLKVWTPLTQMTSTAVSCTIPVPVPEGVQCRFYRTVLVE